MVPDENSPLGAGIILGMDSANERRLYVVTSSIIGWAHTQNNLQNGTHDSRYRLKCFRGNPCDL